MNRKQLVILLVLVVVLGGIGLSLYNKSSDSFSGSSRTGEKLLGDFNINDVAEIHIKQDDKQVNLVKQSDIWTVKERGNYPANFEQISDLVRKAADLKVVQTMEVGASQRGRVGLGDKGTNAATVLALNGAGGKEIKTLSLGAKHMRKSSGNDPYGGEGFPDGRYVLTKGSEVVSVVSEPFSNAEPKPETWLNKDFFKIEKIKSLAYQPHEATNAWKVTRDSEAAEFKLADVKAGENFDTNKVASFGSALSYPSFTDVVVDKKAEELGLDKPTTFTAETFDGFTYTLKVGNKAAEDSYPVQVVVTANLPKERTAGKDEKKEDKEKLDKEFTEANKKLEEKLAQEKTFEKWVYLVPKWTFEQIMKNRLELMVDKKDEQKRAEKDGDGDASAKVDSIVAPPIP